MKKKIIGFLLSVGIITGLSAEISFTDYREKLQRRLQKQLSDIKKTLKCAWGEQACSQKEIDEARILVSKIIASFALVSGAVFVMKKTLPKVKVKLKLAQARKRSEEEISQFLSKFDWNNLSLDQQNLYFEYIIVNKKTYDIGQMMTKYPVSKYWVDVMEFEFKKDKSFAQAIYNKMQELVGEGTELKLPSPYVDHMLWKLFRSLSVIPKEKERHESFYEWGDNNGMELEPQGPSKPTVPMKKKKGETSLHID